MNTREFITLLGGAAAVSAVDAADDNGSDGPAAGDGGGAS